MRNNVSPKTLNILKASLPFVPPPMQRNLSYFIKVEEFNNMFNDFSNSLDSTISACEINNNENTPFNPADLLHAIKPYLDKNERDMIDMFMNITTALNIYKSMGNNQASLLGSLLSQTTNSGNSNNTNQTLNNILNSGLMNGLNPNMFSNMTSNPLNGRQNTDNNNFADSFGNTGTDTADIAGTTDNTDTANNTDTVNNTDTANNTWHNSDTNSFSDINSKASDTDSQIIENAGSNPNSLADASIEALQRLITNNTGNQN